MTATKGQRNQGLRPAGRSCSRLLSRLGLVAMGIATGLNAPMAFSQDFAAFEDFYALTPAGDVYGLQFDENTHGLSQTNQPLWRQPGLVALAPIGNHGVYGITADKRIYFASLDPHQSSPLVKLVSGRPVPAIDSAAIAYFGCNGLLYTIEANGDLYTRKGTDWLSAPVSVGRKWQVLRNVGCVNDKPDPDGRDTKGFRPRNFILGIQQNGDLVAYRHDVGAGVQPGPGSWIGPTRTNLNFNSSLPFSSGKQWYGYRSILQTRFLRPGRSSQTWFLEKDQSFGLQWPNDQAHRGVIQGPANLQSFQSVVFDTMDNRPIQ